jgi:hypothetical protein
MAWHGYRTSPTPPNEAAIFRMEQGQEIGRLAHKLYPDGVVVSKRGTHDAIEITQDLVADTKIGTLFEAAFAAGPFVAKADILTRQMAIQR